jgi:uncharacterized protein (DUF433 family)
MVDGGTLSICGERLSVAEVAELTGVSESDILNLVAAGTSAEDLLSKCLGTGRRFGRLSVMRLDENSFGRKWICACLCGKEKSVLTESLRQGVVTSCGCRRDGRKNLVGLTFGRFTVLESGHGSDGKASCRCLCRCGVEKSLAAKLLISGMTLSCGCLHRDVLVSRGSNLAGQSFGRLTVLGMAQASTGRGHTHRWLCRCSCGKETVVPTDSLTGGNTTSCGCARTDGVRVARRAMARSLVLFGERLTYQDMAELTGLTVKTIEKDLDRGWSAEEILQARRRSDAGKRR